MVTLRELIADVVQIPPDELSLPMSWATLADEPLKIGLRDDPPAAALALVTETRVLDKMTDALEHAMSIGVPDSEQLVASTIVALLEELNNRGMSIDNAETLMAAQVKQVCKDTR